MEKYLLITKSSEFNAQAEVIFRFRNIKFEKINETQYWIWATEEDRKHLNSLEYMACIRTGV